MYQALYRKYRPQTFAEVVGQQHISRTLAGEVDSGRTAHAYLFNGSRGTGKTTCARILAKAVNCESPVAGDPCNACGTCRGIDAGTVLDIVELDAASNTSVDDMRELIDGAVYSPISAKRRVYIIDEFHMLSKNAFNALLKTLEEPPEHLTFVLATTEIHKVPATVISRCQRFDFKRIMPTDILGRLNFIAANEGFALDEDAGYLIARIADGSLRDAVILLDLCSLDKKRITLADVRQTAGLADKSYLYRLSAAMKEGDTAAALDLIAGIYRDSCDMELLCVELIDHFRNLLVAKTVRQAADVIVCPPAELEEIKALAARFTLRQLFFALDTLEETLGKLRKGLTRRVELEMAVLRLSRAFGPQTDGEAAGKPDAEEPRPAAAARAPGPAPAGKRTESPAPAAEPVQDAPTDPAAQEPEAPAAQEVPCVKAGGEPPAGEAETEAPDQGPAVPEEPAPEASEPAGSEPAPEPAQGAAEPTGAVSPGAAAAERPEASPPEDCPSEEGEPFDGWDAVLADLQTACPALTGFLAGSTARLDGRVLTVAARNKLAPGMCVKENCRPALAASVAKAAGAPLKVVVKFSDAPPPKKAGIDGFLKEFNI